MSAFPRSRPSSSGASRSGSAGRSKRARSSRSAPPSNPVRSEEAVLDDLTALETRVADFLREIQAELSRASAYMLDRVLGSYVQAIEDVQARTPALAELHAVNEEVANNIQAMRSLR